MPSTPEPSATTPAREPDASHRTDPPEQAVTGPEQAPPAVDATGPEAVPESTTDGEAADGGQGSRLRWLVLAIVTSAAFLDTLDVNIVTVVLPVIQADLHTDFATAQWTLAGYALAFALFLITGGRLGDIAGRKRVFMSGVAGFTAASVVCGLAPTAEVLVAGRLVQGFTAALMVPQVMSVIMTLFRPKEWPVAFAVLGGALSLGSVGGPLLGGLLNELDLLGLGWRAIFLVNLPVGLITLALAGRFLPETRAEVRPRLDLTGVALLTAATFAVMYPLVQGREQGWPAWMFVSMAVAVPLMVLFAVHQRRRDARDGSALVPPVLFSKRTFSVGLAVTLLAFTGIGSLALLITYHLQYGLGWSALQTALATAAWPVGIAATFQIAWRHGTGRGRLFVGAGTALMGVGTMLMILLVRVAGADLSWAQVAGVELIIGFGMGLCSPVLAAVVLGDVPQEAAGAGSGVVNAVTQFGGAVGVAVVGTLFFGLTRAAEGAGGSVDTFVSATSTALWCNVGAFLLTALLSPLLPRPPQAAPDGTDAAADPEAADSSDREPEQPEKAAEVPAAL